MTIRVGILGAGGRMGRMLTQVVRERSDRFDLVGLVEHSASPLLETEPDFTSDLAGVCQAADVVIDFTLPTATDGNLAAAQVGNCAVVLGTTGLSAEQEASLESAAKHIPVLYAANYSLGVNLLLELTRQAAKGVPDFDVEIVEMHHGQKVDAPSGTALALGKAAAVGRDWDFDAVARLSREGHTGVRAKEEIGFATLRGGDVAGDHSVILAGPRETITLQHYAGDRVIFAQGAVSAAGWLAGKAPGLYGMRDVLGFA